MPAIVTLSSNFGLRDFYIAKWKGMLLSAINNVNCIDITHDFMVENWITSVFAIKNTYADCPEGTVHLVACNLFYNTQPELLCFAYNKHYFIVPNNGVIAMLFDVLPVNIIRIQPKSNQNIYRDYLQIYTQAAAHIIAQNPIETLGTACTQPTTFHLNLPYCSNNKLYGRIEYIDIDGNLISNIEQTYFNECRQGRAFVIIAKDFKNEEITLNTTYYDLQPGKKVLFFNSIGLLQISLMLSSAAKLLNFKLNDEIIIRFIDK
jgi:S-adenosylmethionine hydrolase